MAKEGKRKRRGSRNIKKKKKKIINNVGEWCGGS